jgi:hypothetical protein
LFTGEGAFVFDLLEEFILDLRSILFIKEFLNLVDLKSNGVTARYPELVYFKVDMLLYGGLSSPVGNPVGGLKGLTRS